MDHETEIDHLPHIVTAIRDLGDVSTLGTLKQFLTLYHADSSFIEHEDTLALTASSILSFDSQESSKRFITQIMEDPQTLPELKKQLEEALNPAAAAKAKREAKEQAEKEAKLKAAAELEAQKSAAKARRTPDTLERSTINRTIASYQQHFKPCVQAALGLAPTLQRIRMRFVITGRTGKASDLRILPNNIPKLAECLSGSLEMVNFPKFRNLRQMATYTITIHNNAAAAPVRKAPAVQEKKPDSETDPDAFDTPGGADAKDPDAF